MHKVYATLSGLLLPFLHSCHSAANFGDGEAHLSLGNGEMHMHSSNRETHLHGGDGKVASVEGGDERLQDRGR